VRPEGAERALVLTLDVITPIVDDPRSFGRLAAANALSDVYAMGGEPELSLSFAGMPAELGLEALEAVLGGMAEMAREAGCAIVGGHTIRDSEPKCGLAVIGSVEPGGAWTHRGARAGQALLLSKRVGTGVLAQAMRLDDVDPADFDEAVRSMETLNRAARDAGRNHGATAATDITGFGLLGHLHQLLQASNVAAVLRVADVPLFSGALRAARAGHVPGGSKRNLDYVRQHLQNAERIDPGLLTLLADAQTSGGLLLALPAERAVRALEALGPAAAWIGEIVEGTPGAIELL